MGKTKKVLNTITYIPKRIWQLSSPPRKIIKAMPWWQRWPVYLVTAGLIFYGLSWLADSLMPQVKNPIYGASFSEPYAKELGNDWQANYLALFDDLHFKQVRLMSYWEDIEPQPGGYNFTDLDWQIQQAAAHGATVSLAIGYRQPRWPECHEPGWAANMPIESTQWRSALYSYMQTVIEHYKNSPGVTSYQLENEAVNSLFGGCRGGNAPRDRLNYEFNMVKQLDPSRPTYMSLSDEHGLPMGTPVPDGYGFSIYRVVYSSTFPVHFYATYPITDWFHRLRIFAVTHLKHRPVFIHELQLEPWGSKDTKDMTIAEQNKSMNVKQMQESLKFARKTGIRDEYLWGAEWWYWRKTHFNDPGPWNVVRQAVANSDRSPLTDVEGCIGAAGYTISKVPAAICN